MGQAHEKRESRIVSSTPGGNAMTSLAFILGLVPLVLASGAGANAQKSIGFATLTGMIGSTLLTVAVVPSLFVVLQQIEARLTSPKARSRRSGG
jgi:HAE1 family hydrophobic/amphiphilic exporter-1